MRVFIAHSSRDRELVSALIEALQKQGDDVVDPIGEIRAGDLLSQVSTLIHSADVVVAVLSGRSPNVYYELGLAAGAGKPVLVVAPSGEPLASDLSALPYTLATGDTPRDAQTAARRISQFRIDEQQRTPGFESAKAALQGAIADPTYLESMSSVEFEQLVADLFRENGFTVQSTRETRDLGYDFAVDSPKHGGLILVEAKKMNRQSLVSVEAVRQLTATIPVVGAVSGILISTSGFTSAASALGAAASVTLRTLDDLLKAKSEEDLLGVKKTG
jgi:hypothetical protein